MNILTKIGVVSTLLLPTVSSGKSVRVDEGQLTVTLPDSWQAKKGEKGLRAILYAPPAPENAFQYQPNITVQRFAKSKYITPSYLKSFYQFLKKNVKSQSQLKAVRWQKPKIITKNGQKTAVFRAELLINDAPITQISYLIPAKKRAYLLSYTDATQNTKIAQSSYNEALAILSGARVSEPKTKPVNTLGIVGLLALVLLALSTWIIIAHRNREEKLLNSTDDYHDDENRIDISDIEPLEFDSASTTSSLAI